MEEQIANTENQTNTTERKPTMSLYALEYGFIPQVVEWYRREQIPVEALLDLNAGLKLDERTSVVERIP